MKTPNITAWRREIRARWARVRAERFWRDRLSLGLLVGGLALNAVNIIILTTRIKPAEFGLAVPVHYSNLNNGFDILGPWYQNYGIGFFALLTTVINGGLAWQSFNRSRITSFFLLVGSWVVGVFSLIISLALTSVV